MYRRIITLTLSALIVSALSLVETQAKPSPSAPIEQLAKKFGVSPELLSEFKDKGLDMDDLENGMKVAKEVVKKGDLKIEDATEKVLTLRDEGKEWTDIAKEFDVSVPKDMKSKAKPAAAVKKVKNAKIPGGGPVSKPKLR